MRGRRAARGAARAGALALGLTALLACAAIARPAHEELERRIIEVAEQLTPSVVHVEAIVKFNDRRNQVTGSGLIVSEDGAILTNEHVVDNAEKITVSVPGTKRKYSARLIGADRQTDIALLRITPTAPLRAAKLGSSESLRVGQWVLAIGNPYGLEGTVSFGIVSAKGRNLDRTKLLNDFVQTDAMIDRGSSGGPLVDLDARVVGINSRGQGRGIGFTIPIETAQEVMRQLERGGIERGFLGISIQALDRDLADYFEVPDATGVVVNSVVADSPAAAAKLEPGDILTRFDGAAVEAEKDEDLGAFQRLVAGVEPGETVQIEMLRDGERRSAEIKIGTQPKLDANEIETGLGFHVQEITANLMRDHRLGSAEGAFVVFVERGSPAREAGLRVGDVILRIEDTPIVDLDDFRAAVDRASKLSRFLVSAKRGDETKFLLLKPGAPSSEEPGPEDSNESPEAGLPGGAS